MRALFIALTVIIVHGLEAVTMPSIVPQPVSITKPHCVAPEFILTPDTVISAEACFMPVAQLVASELRAATGFPFDTVAPTGLNSRDNASPHICFLKRDDRLAEGYQLVVTQNAICISASTPSGAFYGYQTLRQLLPPQIYAKTPQTGVDWKVPTLTINDQPRLQWRGLHFDDCRHFIGKEGFKEMIDAMAAHKMNVLHWHLTDDQGWRIEIKQHPEIIAKGAIRAESPIMWDRWRGDGTPYGPYYYTQEDIRELVAYAAERFITVVPEIEMPGHAVALLSAFPELGCTGGPYEPWCRWGVSPEIACAGNDATLKLYEEILDEVLALFPSTYIHCGGDEAPKERWKACAKCQQRIKDKGLRDENHLQTWFMQHFATYLEQRGRHMIGWDEILEGGLPKGAAVMSWRGASGGITAAKMGHPVVMTPNSHAYLDYGQGLVDDPYEYIGSTITLKKTYALNPTDGIPPAMHPFVIGVQGNLWSEYIWNKEDQQWKAWPRAAAIAEIGWTPQAKREWTDFRQRMEQNTLRLKTMGINVAPMDPAEPFAEWTSQQIPTDRWTVLEWDVTETLHAPGTYSLTFLYTSGFARLDIRKVTYSIGDYQSIDAHKGTTGGVHINNVYTFKVPTHAPKGRRILRAEVRTDGSSDSNGQIILKKH